MRQLRILVAALIGCLFTIATAQVAGAWTVETSASATCPEGSQSVVVKVSFTNNDHRSMYVSAVDRDTSVYANLGEVKPGQTASASLKLAKTSVGQGLIFFDMEWTDGDGGDSREAVYEAAGCKPLVTTTTMKTTTTTVKPSAELLGSTQAYAKCETVGVYSLRVEVSNNGDANWTVTSSPTFPQLVGLSLREGTAEARNYQLPGATTATSYQLAARAEDGRAITLNGSITPGLDGKCTSDIVTTTTSTSTTSTTAPAVTTTTTPSPTTTPGSTGNPPTELAYTGPNGYTPWLVVGGLLLFAAGSSILLARKPRRHQADEA